MSTYDTASLILIPSGVKDGKVYSAKPTNGDGDFTFTRASEATRLVDGVVTKVRTNSILQSNDLDTTWSFSGSATITGGQADKDGGTNAWKLESPTAGGSRSVYQNVTKSGINTFSAYLKAGTADWVVLYTVGSGDPRCWFDLTNGVIGTSTLLADASIEDVGGGWYRCSITTNTAQTSWRFYLSEGDNSYQAALGDNVIIQSSQLEQGLVATDYIATTTVAVSEGPVANMPRLNSVAGGCSSLKLEPQRTNLLTQSEYYGGSYWTKSGASIVDNAIASPDGYVNAAKLVEDTGSGGHSVFRNSSTVTLASHSLSCFAKTNGRNLKLDFFGGVNNAIFNLTSGAVISTTGSGLTAEIETFANGWYRCSVTQVQTVTTIYPNVLCADNSNNSTYTGDGTSGIYIYGAQLEAGSYATSYIPTYGTAATRVADACSKTGITSLIGQTEGTIYLEYEKKSNGAGEPIWLSDGTYNNFIYFSEGSNISYQGIVSGTQWNITSGTLSLGRHKIAAAYKQNDIVLYIDGVQIGNDTSANIPTCSLLGLGYENGTIYNNGNPYNQVLLFKTRLTNAELETLTTL
jgi:hypothetical protein